MGATRPVRRLQRPEGTLGEAEDKEEQEEQEETVGNALRAGAKEAGLGVDEE
jgi:hypothetical protein